MAPKQKLLAPNSTYVWVPQATGPANSSAMTFAMINAGNNISCGIVLGPKVNAAASDKDTTRTICDAGNVDNPTNDNYTGDMTFLRDNGDANPIPAAVLAWGLFQQAGNYGFIVKREGKLSTVPFAAGDIVSVFLFENDYPVDIEGKDDAAPVQWSTKFIPKGDMALNITL